jgi:hypothetical protein
MLSDYLRKISGFKKVILGIAMLFFVFNLTLLIISLFLDSGDLKQMVKMARYISYIKYVVIINLILFNIILGMYYFEIKKLKKISKELEQRNIRLKSDLFDASENKTGIAQRA